MSDDDSSTTTNIADNGSAVGIQAEWVHNSTVYMVSREDPPERIYEVGVNYLNNGVPLRARELIDDALARGYDNAEVRFHWALAMLSKRSYRELSTDERAQLARLPEHLTTYPHDEWTRAVAALCDLLAHLDRADRDPTSALTKLNHLPARQREKITQHCDLVLTGGMKDSLWAETLRDAQEQQHADDRENRVWAYFEPDPMPARARQPAPDATTAADRFRAVLATALLAGALGYLGWILLLHLSPIPVLAYLLMVASAAVAARSGFEWRYRAQRLRAKEREHVGSFADSDAPAGGFANRVDHAFQHYAHKYAPAGVDRSVWLAETRGIRTTLRDEVVELYREDRVRYDRVAWLIRFLVLDVRRRWNENVLFAYRQQYRTAPSTQTWCLAGIAVAVLAACAVVDAAVRADPLPALASVLIAVGGGRATALRWWHILSEHRRFAETDREYVRARRAREAAHRGWQAKLDDTCPTEEEIEHWLRCDRILLIGEALRHYRLAWRDITAYTIVQTPAKGYKRARVDGGPWRYSKSDLRLLLITAEGVREMARTLKVEHGTFHGHERGHFRFDAVSSLRVVESGNDYTLELTLSNGPTRTIDLSEPERTPEQTSLDEPGLARMSLDATGFTHALHVLEGIAAEGKAWIQHEDSKTRSDRPSSPGSEAAA